MRIRQSILLLLLFVATAVFAQRDPSTAEERQRYLKIVAALEQQPLGSQIAKKDVNWALQWLIDVPDIHVSQCGGPVTVALLESRRTTAHELIWRFTLAMGAYNIHHPEFGPESAQQQGAGLESILKAYAADVQQHPANRIKALDDLLEKQKTGHMSEAAATEAANCGGPKQSARYRPR